MLLVLAGIAILVVLYVFAEHIPRTISIFLIAAFIAFGVNPVCRALVRRRVPKALAITIVFLALTIVIVVGLLVIVPLTIAQLQVLATNAPAMVSLV